MSKVTITKVRASDLGLLFKWRHDPEIMKYFQDGFEDWQTHLTWFNSLKKNKREAYMVLYGKIPVGEVHAVWDGKEISDIGIYLDKKFWNKGIGTVALNLLLKDIMSRFDGPIQALIHKDNMASQALFLKFGFRETQKSDLTHIVWVN